MTSYITLLDKLEAWCNAHKAKPRFYGEFREQMPNLSTGDEKYPLIFVVPSQAQNLYDTNTFTLDVYCVDIIQKDRTNINTIVSDCHLILTDLYGYYFDGRDADIDVLERPIQLPVNNFDLDYVAGWKSTMVFEVNGYCADAIPIDPITPNGATCEDATVTNSDVSYSASVASGATLAVPDSSVTVNNVSAGSVVSVKTIDIQLDVTPDTVAVVGNTITIATPDCAQDVFIKGIFAAGNDTMETLTIDADTAGTYTLQTDDGASGTITLDINGGGAAAFVNPTTLAIGDTVVTARTVTTGAGWYKISGTYV